MAGQGPRKKNFPYTREEEEVVEEQSFSTSETALRPKVGFSTSSLRERTIKEALEWHHVLPEKNHQAYYRKKSIIRAAGLPILG